MLLNLTYLIINQSQKPTQIFLGVGGQQNYCLEYADYVSRILTAHFLYAQTNYQWWKTYLMNYTSRSKQK